ncbi:alpha/beta hydrolase family esterase [Nocardia sp. NPDC059240]|uniref:alpha/beta hydrolase family esterase n=1 Tax=Nocardia sp. NPDC059240 TaxID=3346786 RepID=UPI003693DB55
MANIEVQVDGRRRSFALRLPAQRGADLPLVVVLHGNRSSVLGPVQRFADARARRGTGFDACVDRYGIAVAYPDAFGGGWADGRGVSAGDRNGVDDVTFLRAISWWCAEQCGTRDDGVLVAGISNGAFMAHRMALEAADLVSAFVAVAGGLPAALTGVRPTHAVSALLMNGTADRIVPIGGGHSRRRGPNGELRGRTLSLTESGRRWAASNRCTGIETAERHPAGPAPTDLAVTRRAVGDGVGGTRVETWAIHGMGHTWPGAPVPTLLQPLLGKSPLNIDAADEFCRFSLPRLTPADERRLPPAAELRVQ